MKIEYLQNNLKGLANYPLHSRIHPLKTFQHSFVKRDDELGFGISGSKIRKYASLIPFFINNKIEEVIIIGGAYSNHVLGITQLLIENNIKPTLFLLASHANELRGNALLTSLLVSNKHIHWISRKDWADHKNIVESYAEQSIYKNYIVPEGALTVAALPGALTLPLDIICNEAELSQPLGNIFIEAGTGLMAIATILTFCWLKHSAKIHVVLLADNKVIFLEKLSAFQPHFENIVKEKVDWRNLSSQFELHEPRLAKSFGSSNSEIFKTIKSIAKNEGFFVDPIYSAKLFYESNWIINTQNLDSPSLILHSGGGLSLMGFQNQLRTALRQ